LALRCSLLEKFVLCSVKQTRFS